MDGYCNKLKDKIISAPSSDDPYIWLPYNVGKVDAKGIDASLGLRYDNGTFAGGLSARYARQSALDKTPDSYTYDQQIPYVAKNTVVLAGDASLSGWRLDAVWNLRSGRFDANGENDNFYADNTVYYVINNNAGYEGDLEIALITTDFATDILGEQLDSKGVLVERNDAETSQFALLFEFDGDKNHIRHVLYCCSASRPATEGQTTEESKEVKTETLSLKASALPSGLVKSKTCESTDETTYNNWYNTVYIPTAATTNNSTNTRSASTTKGGSTAASTTTD